MNKYTYSANVRTSIDNIQKDYDCCGSNMWLDWNAVSLLTVPSDTDSSVVQTSSSQSGIYTTPIMSTISTRTSTASMWSSSTTNAITNTDVEVIVNNGLGTTTVTDDDSTTTTPYVYPTKTRKQNQGNRNTTHTSYYYNVLAQMGLGSLVQSSKKKRAAQTDNDNTYDSSMLYPVTLPQSCCTNDVPSLFNSLDPCEFSL